MASVTALQPAAKSLAAADALVLEGVSRAFGALRAIEDISFSVAVGERRAVLGANGAGKTTLFNAITGDFPPTAGRVRFFGEDITDLPPYERIRRGLRRTYQSSLLFRNLTVRDNLFLATRGVSRSRFSFVRPHAGRVEPCAEMRNLGIGARDRLLQATKLQRREIAARHRLGGAVEHERLIAANCHAFTPTMRRIARPSL